MNMRKILAVLVAALMLCTIIPLGAMSVSAAPGDVILQGNFDDNNNIFNGNATIEDGALHWDTSAASWAHLTQGITVAANTDYVVSFKMKSSHTHALSVKFMLHDWGTQVAGEKVNPTSEWAEYSVVLNSGANTSILFMIQTNVEGSVGQQVYIDDFSIVEYKEPLEVGVVKNGNFENGSEGWTLNGSASIENGALKLDNSGQWSEAAMAEIAVEVGTEYTLTWKSQRVSGNGAYLMFVLKGSDLTNHGTTGQNWMNETSGNWVESSLVFTATEETLKLKISAEVNNPGVILIDDVKLTATPKVVVGQITNGDFETGDAAGWRTWQSTEINAAAAHSGSYGANIKGNGGWGGFLDQDFQVEDGKTYEFSFWFKVNSSGFNWSLKGDQTGASYGSGWKTTTTWTQVTQTFVANGDTSIYLNFNGGGNGVAEDAYIDDVKLVELVDPSDDGYVINGNFETGVAAPWTTYSGSNVSADAAKNGNYGLICTNPNGGWGGTAFQDFSVEIGKSYEVTMWAKAISQGQNIQIQNGGATVASTWYNKTEWNLLTFEFTAVATGVRINICGGGTGANEMVYFDDIKVIELKEPSFDGYIYNGDFETGEVFPWDNLWGSCPTVEIVEGMDGYGLHIVSGQWNHVRQTAIAVQPNTWCKVTVWAKNASDMCILVKNNADNDNLVIAGVNAGDEWTEFTAVFNSKDYDSILFSLMGGENPDVAEKYGTFDNIKMEVTEEPACEHESDADYPCQDGICNICGEVVSGAGHEYFNDCENVCLICNDVTREASHNVVHVEAADATCDVNGNVEFWYCDVCGAAWLDAECTMNTNRFNVIIPAPGHQYYYECATQCIICWEEIKSEPTHSIIHVEAKAPVSCVEYGNKEYWYCEYCFSAWLDEDLYRSTAIKSTILAGECVSDAEFPCQVAPCIGCGMDVIPDEPHTYDDEYDADCNVCGDIREVEERPVEIIYGDADGDGEVSMLDLVLLQQYTTGEEVTIDEVAADADGDGEVTMLDLVLLQQYTTGWDVTLGPV